MSEKIKSIGGPGGLRCPCCGGSGRSRRKSSKRAVRKMVRKHRRKQKMEAIQEWEDECTFSGDI